MTRAWILKSRPQGPASLDNFELRDREDALQFRMAWNAALRPGFDNGGGPSARKLTNQRQATSSVLKTLQTCLGELRAREQRLGSRQGG